ncbi:hypothetical protein ACFVUY_11605 [Kitasatospora sp. NPDC058063]|uniref:hypothetical protein n=1 Tax=unclassified Kitasatospora TaxID=2633591 RepID=UPI0036DE5B6F
MPNRLLAALLLGLFSLLPIGCAERHHDARPHRSPAATAPVSTQTTTAPTTAPITSAPTTSAPTEPSGAPAGSPERSCPEVDDLAPAQRSVRTPAASLPFPAQVPVADPGAGRAEPPAPRPAAAVGRAARTTGPRGPLLVTGRWRI